METASSYMKLLPSSLSEATSFAEKLINEIDNGIINPLDLLVNIKAIEKSFELVKETLMQNALDEANKYEKSFEFKGTKIERVEVGTKYDYSNCNDFKLAKIADNLNHYSEQKKQRENMLKTLKSKLVEIDEETGDINEIYPPIKTSTTSLKVTMLK